MKLLLNSLLNLPLYLLLLYCIFIKLSRTTDVSNSKTVDYIIGDIQIDYLSEEEKAELIKKKAGTTKSSSIRIDKNFTNYSNQLTEYEKEIYNQIYEGSKKSPPEKEFEFIYDDSLVQLNKTEFKEKLRSIFVNLITVLEFDNPNFWWISNYKGTYYYDSNEFKHEIILETNPSRSLFYNYTDTDFISINRKIEIMKNDIIKKIDALELTTKYAILYYIHNYLIVENTYLTDSNRKHIRTIYGSLVENACVCVGYSKAIQYLAQHYGIECILAISLRHEWNYVKMGDKWYVLDATWDDPLYSSSGSHPSGYNYDRPKKISNQFFVIGTNTLNTEDTEKHHEVVYSTYYNYDTVYYPPISSDDYVPTEKEKEEIEKIDTLFTSSYISTAIGKYLFTLLLLLLLLLLNFIFKFYF